MADQEAMERAGEAMAVGPVRDGEDTGQCSVRSRIGDYSSVGTHYCLAVGNDKGFELDKTDEDEELSEGDEEQVEEDKGEDVRGIQSGGGR